MAYDDCYRKLVNSRYLEGKKCYEIYHALAKKVKKRTINQWIQVFVNNNQIEAKKIKTRARKVRTKKLVKKIKKSQQKQLLLLLINLKVLSIIYQRKSIKQLGIIKRNGRKLISNDFILQKDGASSHRSKETRQAFENRGIPIIHPCHWPLNSPDLHPLDYFFLE